MNKSQFRVDTDGCYNQIFLNNAGSALMPKVAIDAMTNYLQQENLIGGYEFANQQTENFNCFSLPTDKL